MERKRHTASGEGSPIDQMLLGAAKMRRLISFEPVVSLERIVGVPGQSLPKVAERVHHVVIKGKHAVKKTAG